MADFQDWELLHSPQTQDNPLQHLDEADSAEDGAINPDYFALDSQTRRPALSEGDETGADSDNPSWVDPDSDSDSDSRYGDHVREQLGFVGNGFPINNSVGFWSDESSEGQQSVHDSERGELFDGGEDLGGKDVGSGEIGGGGEVVEMGDGLGSMEEVRAVSKSGESSEKREAAWWKMPLELLKFWVFKMRPFWSISIAAAVMGIVMLGRRLYKMKHKSRSIPLKIALDDKKASQFMARAARLNEAFSVVRRVPVVRPSLSAGSVAQWSVASLR